MTQAHGDTRPIGIFDSGMGGLTVLRALHERLTQESFCYLGDTARLPYGTKSRDTVARYSLQAAAKLVERDIKMLVIACNTATSAALQVLRENFAPLPVIGVIEPGAAAAVAASRSGHIAVIATEGTIQGGAYHRAIHALKPDARITGQACTLFVALAEEGWIEGDAVKSIASRYLDPIFASKKDNAPDTLLLGCTHFPPLKHSLQEIVGSEVRLVDSADTTAARVEVELQQMGIASQGKAGELHFLTTDDTARFARVGSLFLGTRIIPQQVERVDL